MRPSRKLNAFDLTHEHKLTCNMGILVPNLCLDVVPGDTIDLTTDILVRTEAMIAPVMHRYDVKYHVFYLPERCMMEGYEAFITGGKDGTDSTVWPHQTSPSGGYQRGSLGDYLGFPCNTQQTAADTNQINGTYDHSAFPMRMYAKVYNHYFINENLQTELASSTAAGLDTTTNTSLMHANWAKSYFTSGLDDTSRGNPVYLPLGSTAPVYGDGYALYMTYGNGVGELASNNGTTPQRLSIAVPTLSNHAPGSAVGDGGYRAPGNVLVGVGSKAELGTRSSGLYTDLSSASSVEYNVLRQAARLNYLLELNKRAGYRLVEWTLAHFGVRVPDDRIQEPVYLGGGSQALMITPIEQTSATSSTSPQGNLAGRGTSALRSRHIRKTFVEHGWVIGIFCIMPKQEYSQGLAKRFQRKTRYDYLLPVMDEAGDQPILNSEIYVSGSNTVDSDGNAVDEKEFAYKPAYEEYRTMPSSVHGEMRKGGSLTYWTGGRLFDSLPQLNSQFVTADPSNRIFAVTSNDVHHFTVECLHHLRMLRPLSKFGDPSII